MPLVGPQLEVLLPSPEYVPRGIGKDLEDILVGTTGREACSIYWNVTIYIVSCPGKPQEHRVCQSQMFIVSRLINMLLILLIF